MEYHSLQKLKIDYPAGIGRIVLEGTGTELMADEKVKEAFLGI